MKTLFKLGALSLLLSTTSYQLSTCHAQGTAFTYQGRLNDGANPANGNYDLRFALYDAASGGAQQGNLLTNSPTAVSNGLFTVALDFGNQFPGAARWLELAVRTNGGGLFDILASRQQITATPYSLQAANAANAATATSATIATAAGTANNFSGSLAGNVTGTQGATVVGSVGGQSAANVASGVSAANAATSANTASTIVKRDASGSFSAGGITGTNFTGNGGGLTNLVTTNLVGTLSPVNFGLGQITGPMLAVNSVSAGKIGPGSVVKTLNGLTDSVVLTAGANVTITPSGNNLSIAATIPSTGWSIFGNSGTTTFNFLGTTDNHPLVFKVNGQRTLLLEPGGVSPSVIGGSSNNVAGPYREGVFIGGGDYNTNNDDYAVISGGLTNLISDRGYGSVIGGGALNTIGEQYGVIVGGLKNTIELFTQYATIGGGWHNTNYGSISVIGGGDGNFINASSSTIGGGSQNVIRTNASHSTIGGGRQNEIQTNADYATIGGGEGNAVQTNAQYTTIGGGQSNLIGKDSTRAFIGGGRENAIQTNSEFAIIVGGWKNIIQPNAGYSFIGGGYQNIIEHDYGGFSSAENNYNVIAGGNGNLVGSNANNAVIGGGFENTIKAYSDFAFIGGGYTNTADGFASVIGGGQLNVISSHAQNLGHFSVISGGFSNLVDGMYAVIPGGSQNSASGDYSFAAGRRARAAHDGTFVWADATAADFASSSSNQFNVRASGGVNFDDSTSLYLGSTVRQMLNLYGNSYAVGVQSSTLYQRSNSRFSWFRNGVHSDTQNDPGAGGTVLMTLTTSGLTVNGTFVSASDRNLKENFKPVDAQAVLEKVVALPLSEWNYKHDEEHNRHLGPMAQDFYSAFGVGPDDKHIATIDESGVALAAIQGLNEKLEAQKSENAELKAQLAELKVLVKQLAEKK